MNQCYNVTNQSRLNRCDSKRNDIMPASQLMAAPAVALYAVGQRCFIEGSVMTGVTG